MDLMPPGSLAEAARTRLNGILATRSGGVDFSAYSPADDGSADVNSKLRAAIASAAANNVRRVCVPAGRYLVTVAGDADTILIPSDVYLDCDDGAVFVWSYWGSPLFALINQSRCGIIGASFEWGGTFGTTSGGRDALGYGATIPAYEWCSHVIAAGSDHVRLEGLSCWGTTTANRQNNFISVKPKNDGVTPVTDIRIRDIRVDDVSQGFQGGGMTDFTIQRMRGGRYATDSAGLYGPGHMMYLTDLSIPTSNGTVEDIRDYATTPLSAFTSGSHTISSKNVQDVEFRGIKSLRREGILNLNKNVRVEYLDLDHYSADASNDTGAGPIFMSASAATPNQDVYIRARIQMAAGKNACPVNMGGLGSGAENLRMRADIAIIHTPTGAESNPLISLNGQDCVLNVSVHNLSSTVTKNDVTLSDNASNVRNTINLKKSSPAVATSSPRVQFNTNPANNKIYFQPDALYSYDRNGATPTNGNRLSDAGAEKYRSTLTSASAMSPSFTFRLPAVGSYLVDLAALSGDLNHAMSGTYRVEWDSGLSNTYADCQLIGLQAQKGSQVTGLAASVDNTGLVTVTLTTTTTDNFRLRFGYLQVSGL